MVVLPTQHKTEANVDAIDVFVSYASEDLQRVKQLIAVFEQQGWNVWWDRALIAGSSYHRKIEEALDSARCVVVVWSRQAIESQWVMTEANEGLERNILVPLLIDDVKPPLAFRISQTANLFHWPDQSGQIENVIEGIAALVGSASRTNQEIAAGQEILNEPQLETKPGRVLLKVTVAAVLLLVVSAVFFIRQDLSRATIILDFFADRSIAVMPFRDLTSDERLEFFGERLSEEILDNLAQKPGLKVASRSSSSQYSSPGLDAVAIGEQLNVAYILEGSVQQQYESIRVTVQLIRTADNFHVWSKTYDGKLPGGIALQSRVAANAWPLIFLNLTLDQRERWVSGVMGLVFSLITGYDKTAYGHYLKAMKITELTRLGEIDDTDAAVSYLKKAIEIDPAFKLAYTSLIFVYLNRFNNTMSLAQASKGAHEAARAALALDPDDPGLQLQLGQLYTWLDLDFAKAEQTFFRLHRTHPDAGTSTSGALAVIALTEGRLDDAMDAANKMVSSRQKTGGNQAVSLRIAAWTWYLIGDYERALKYTSQVVDLLSDKGPAEALLLDATILLALGRLEEARGVFEAAWAREKLIRPERYVALLVGLNRRTEARQILLESPHKIEDAFFIAVGYLSLGLLDETFAAIEVAIEDHNIYTLASLRLGKLWDPIRDDPRFDEMIELMDSKITYTSKFLVMQDVKPKTSL